MSLCEVAAENVLGPPAGGVVCPGAGGGSAVLRADATVIRVRLGFEGALEVDQLAPLPVPDLGHPAEAQGQ